MSQFRMVDAPSLPATGRVVCEMILSRDMSADAPDANDAGFWPSRDPNDAGYTPLTGAEFEEAWQAAQDRMDAWKRDEWHYVGVICRATFHVPVGGNSFAVYTLESPGLWGVESDAGDYLTSVFEEQKTELFAAVAGMAKLTTAFMEVRL